MRTELYGRQAVSPWRLQQHTTAAQSARVVARAGGVAPLAAATVVGRPADVVAVEGYKESVRLMGTQTSSNGRAVRQAAVAREALGEVAGLLGEVRETIETGAAAGQNRVDALLADVDRLARTTSAGGVKLLDGQGAIVSSARRIVPGAADTRSLGKLNIEGRAYSVNDLRSGGSLAIGQDEAKAKRVLGQATLQVGRMYEAVGQFERDHAAAWREGDGTNGEVMRAMREMKAGF